MLNRFEISDIVAATVANRAPRAAEAIVRRNLLMERLRATEADLPFYVQVWHRILKAWPLQWKRDELDTR